MKKFIHTNIKTEDELTALIDTICQFQYNDVLQRRLGCFLLQLLTKRKLSVDQMTQISEFLIKQLSNDENGGGQELYDVQYSADVSLTFGMLKEQLYQKEDTVFDGLQMFTDSALTERDLAKAKTCLRAANYLRSPVDAGPEAITANNFIEKLTRQALTHSLEQEYGRDVQFYQELLQSAYESDLSKGLDETQLENLFQTIVNNLKSQNPATQDNAIRCLDKYFGLFASKGFLDRLRALGNAKCDAYLDENLPKISPEPELVEPEPIHSVQDLHNSQEEREELEVVEPPPKKFKSPSSAPPTNELWFLENDDLIIYHIEDECKMIAQDQNQWFVNFDGQCTSVMSSDQRQMYYQIQDSELQHMLTDQSQLNQNSTSTQFNLPRANSPKIPRPDSPHKSGNALLNKRKMKQNFTSRFNVVPFTQEIILEGELSNELLQQVELNNLSNMQIINLLTFLMKQKPCYEKLDYINKDKLNDIVSILTLHGYVDQMQNYIKESMKYSKFTSEQSKDIILGLKKLNQKHPLYQWGQGICAQLQKPLTKMEQQKYSQLQTTQATQDQASSDLNQTQVHMPESIPQSTVEIERTSMYQ